MRLSDAQAGGSKVHAIETVGNRIAVHPNSDFTLLGSALHNCIACDTADPEQGIGLGEVKAILDRWGIGAAVEAQAALDQINAFTNWWRARWPDSEAHAEMPFEAKRADGAIARGQIDFLLKTPVGRVLFDYKSDPRGGAAGNDDRLALEHGCQLAEYAMAVEMASGEPILEWWLFLPVWAQVVRIVEGRF